MVFFAFIIAMMSFSKNDKAVVTLLMASYILARLWIAPSIPRPRDYAHAAMSLIRHGLCLVSEPNITPILAAGGDKRKSARGDEGKKKKRKGEGERKKTYTDKEIKAMVLQYSAKCKKPPDNEHDEEQREQRPTFKKLGEPNNLKEMFFITQVMLNVLHILREIFDENPGECPYVVVLVVDMFNYIEHEMDINDPNQINQYIKYIRGRFKSIGDPVNCKIYVYRVSLSRLNLTSLA